MFKLKQYAGLQKLYLS